MERILEIAAVILMAAAMLCMILSVAVCMADEDEGMDVYVICQPGSYVNIRTKPNSKSDSIGRYETGDRVHIDGTIRIGYCHCDRLALEDTEGWIHLGYVVTDEPVWEDGAEFRIRSNGRVAARRSIEGDRTAWLKTGSSVQVFWRSDEWSLTNRGFVKTEYLVREEK